MDHRVLGPLSLPSEVEDLPGVHCTVHKHRSLLAYAPKSMHEELSAGDRDMMIDACSAAEVQARRKAFLRKWRLKCPAVADSLEEAGERLFCFTHLDPAQWRAVSTTNAIEQLNEEFRRRIKTQNVLPCAETMTMLLWVLLASGQVLMHKVDGWTTVSQPIPLDNLRDSAIVTSLGEFSLPQFLPVSRHSLALCQLKKWHSLAHSACV